jgi:hypothetical protein
VSQVRKAIKNTKLSTNGRDTDVNKRKKMRDMLDYKWKKWIYKKFNLILSQRNWKLKKRN